MNTEKSLFSLKTGEKAHITKLNSEGSMRRRLQDIGFSEGAAVMCLLKASHGDPSAYLIKGAVIALRKEDSSEIMVI